MEIEYVTHASLFLKSGRLSLLTDPFYFFDPVIASVMLHFPPREIDLSLFGDIDYVYSSHIHPDHSHPETLRLLKARIGTVLLPARRPDLEARYRGLGFTDIILLKNGETLSLRDGSEVTSYWDDPTDTVLIVKMDGQVILHANDCVLEPETLTDIAGRFKVDYAFINYTAAQNLYPLLLPRSEEELLRLAQAREEDFFNSQLELVEILQPEVIIPYSMTMTYFQPDQIHLNGYGRMTPPLFRDKLRAYHPETPCRVIQPGDVIDTRADSVRQYREENLWGGSLREYLQNVADYAESLGGKLPAFDFGEPEMCEPMLKDFLRERISRSFIPQLENKVVALRITGGARSSTYILDVKAKRVYDCAEGQSPERDLFLKLDVPASLIQVLRAKTFDPFTVLFFYRIKFQLNPAVKMAPDEETELYILSLMSIFDQE